MPPRTSRVHVALNVQNLEASIAFYRTLLGEEPSKTKADYAKFEPVEPPVHLSLNPSQGSGESSRVSHFGVQVWSKEALERTARRLQDAGLSTTPEEQVTCCYAVQDKLWVEDPDGNAWEIFLTQEDAAIHSDRAAGPDFACCPTESESESGGGCC